MAKNTAVEIVTVMPATAREWLSKNVGNRHISPHTVDGYTAEMKAKRWRLTGDAIMFNLKGELINGQHRLTALVNAGIGCPFLVMRNCEDESKEVLDQGRARSVPDMMKMIYGTTRATLVTGAIRIIDDFVYGQKFKLSVGHAMETMEKFDEAFKWAVDTFPGKSTFSASAITAAMIYAYKTAPTSVDLFARRLFSGADLAASSPVFVVRNQLQRTGSLIYRDQKREAFMIVLHAIHKSIKGEHVTSKNIRVREDMIEIFSAVHRSARDGKKKAAA